MTCDNKIRIIPLGGLGEIGKNITAFEFDDEIIVLDCGLAFPDEDMYGVDLILPDITYLLKNIEKVKGIFLTHGHEDHIGALPYIMKQINVPIYGTNLTLGIVENKLIEHEIADKCKLCKVRVGDVINFNKIAVEFIQSTHSIADSCFIAITTPVGAILHTGDFKIDYTPIDGNVIDLDRIAEIGRKGVLCLMADSTNVERKGHTMSESSIGATLTRIISKAKGRVIVATFASNIHRIQQIIDSSMLFGRKITFSGRSMENMFKVATELGYLHVPEGTVISLDDLDKHRTLDITIITTGSQGEQMAGLSRIAFENHRKIKIEKDDLYIISASPIPGNQKMISNVINQLFKKGADVIYEDLEDIHVSGHACQEELKLIHTIVNPKYFVPVHGEYRHLKHHSDLAQSLGMSKSNIFILENGEILALNYEGASITGKVKTGRVFVDGLGVGDVGSLVLRDRRFLAQDGMVTIVVTIDRDTYSISAGPDIITRGFVYVKEAEELLANIKNIARCELEKCLDDKIVEWYIIKLNMKKSVEKYIYEVTKRRPSIIPIIMEI